MEFYSKRVEIKACCSFEVSSTILTMYPIIFSLIVNHSTIMAYVVASVFFFGVITFVTVCTEVVTTQERERFLKDKRCIIQIENKDDMCCARAIITAKAKIDGHEQWNSIQRGRRIQEELALELHTWRLLLVEIKACWSFEVSSTILTMYPIIFSLIVNLSTIMAYVVASACGNVYCKTCKDYYSSGHQCYMLPVDYNDRQKKQTYIFFDFECTQDDRIQCQQGYQTIMAYVVASVFFFCAITFVTVCTEVVTTQERSHAGNHIVVVVVIVQVDLLPGCGSMVNDYEILFKEVIVSKKSWRWN
jgi:hypothetical protein